MKPEPCLQKNFHTPHPTPTPVSALTCLWDGSLVCLGVAHVSGLKSGVEGTVPLHSASVLLSMSETVITVFEFLFILHGWPLLGGGGEEHAFRSQRQVPTARGFSAPPATASFLLAVFSHTGACSRHLHYGPSCETALLVFVRAAAFPCVALAPGESSQGQEPRGSRVITSVFRMQGVEVSGWLSVLLIPSHLSLFPGPVSTS